MRLIDADTVIVEIGGGYIDIDAESFMSAPTIEIIHCGECKHRKPSGYVGSVKTYECDITGFRMHDLTNHFCSYGERNDDEGHN